jgi:hypothetical protein
MQRFSKYWAGFSPKNQSLIGGARYPFTFHPVQLSPKLTMVAQTFT